MNKTTGEKKKKKKTLFSINTGKKEKSNPSDSFL
jgi:hypothetical protein